MNSGFGFGGRLVESFVQTRSVVIDREEFTKNLKVLPVEGQREVKESVLETRGLGQRFNVRDARVLDRDVITLKMQHDMVDLRGSILLDRVLHCLESIVR